MEVFDAARSGIRPCLGCGKCMAEGKCVQKDGMESVIAKMMDADAIVFVSPMYYFGMTAQLKAVVDRFYPLGAGKLAGKRSALIVAQYNPDPGIAESMITSYRGIARYMGLEDAGVLVASGCGTPADLEGKDFMQRAFELGKNTSEWYFLDIGEWCSAPRPLLQSAPIHARLFGRPRGPGDGTGRIGTSPFSEPALNGGDEAPDRGQGASEHRDVLAEAVRVSEVHQVLGGRAVDVVRDHIAEHDALHQVSQHDDRYAEDDDRQGERQPPSAVCPGHGDAGYGNEKP